MTGVEAFTVGNIVVVLSAACGLVKHQIREHRAEVAARAAPVAGRQAPGPCAAPHPPACALRVRASSLDTLTRGGGGRKR